MLTVVRQSNPNRVVVIGPTDFNDVYEIKSLELPKDDRNIIVTFHYYNPYSFTHQGHWVKDANDFLGMPWKGSEGEKRLVEKDFDIAANWGKENNRPIYLGEFGADYKVDMQWRILWTKCVADTAVEHGFSFSYWEFLRDSVCMTGRQNPGTNPCSKRLSRRSKNIKKLPDRFSRRGVVLLLLN